MNLLQVIFIVLFVLFVVFWLVPTLGVLIDHAQEHFRARRLRRERAAERHS